MAAASALMTSSAPRAVAGSDLVIVRHALVHIRKFLLQSAGFPVEHHQDRGGAKRPASLVADTDGPAGHWRLALLVQAVHLRDIVIHQEAQDQITLAAQIALLLLLTSPGAPE